MVDYLMHFIGVPYIWGGNNPITGFDCSGLICEGLKSEGVIARHKDLTSQGIWDKLNNYYKLFTPGTPKKGDLLFFGAGITEISHVAIAISGYRMLEAGGGGSGVDTIEKAGKYNAFVRISSIRERSDLVGIIRM